MLLGTLSKIETFGQNTRDRAEKANARFNEEFKMTRYAMEKINDHIESL